MPTTRSRRKRTPPSRASPPRRKSGRVKRSPDGERPATDNGARDAICWGGAGPGVRLPPELVLRIFAEIEAERDMESCCCVCKCWYRAARSEFFWLALSKSTWKRPHTPPARSSGSMQSYIQRKSFERGTAALPGNIREYEMDLTPLDMSTTEREKETSLNKIFACAWAEDRVLLAGTKDNQIVRWHFNRDFSIKSREVMIMPDEANHTVGSSYAPKGGQHCIEFNRAFNGSEIAVGGNDPRNILVLDYPSMKPCLKLQGNRDWMFSCCWIDKDNLLSCSRDKTVRLWSTKLDSGADGSMLQTRDPVVTREEHSDKIRDMKFNRHTSQIATMATDGMVKLWDRSNLDVLATTQAPHSQDLVCMAVDDLGSDLICVGSRKHITFIDPRCCASGAVLEIDQEQACYPVLFSDPNESGVRSISFRQHLITVGCGGGHLLFFDMRRNQWCHGGVSGTPPDSSSSSNGMHRRAGQGWILHDQNYSYMYSEDTMGQGGSPSPKHAIYAHAYNHSGRVLFTGGGPLQVGLHGCYGALWADSELGCGAC